MKELLQILLIVLFCVNCNGKAQNKKLQNQGENTIKLSDFIGTWFYESIIEGDSVPNLTFELTLQKESETTVTGQYCCVARGGRRIDCTDDGSQNIKGVYRNDTLYLSFYGFYDETAKGEAKVYKSNNKNQIIWELGKCNGELYVPLKKTLEREYQSNEINASTKNINNDVEHGSSDLANYYNKAVSVNLPQHYSFEFIIDNSDFIKLPQSFVPILKLAHFEDLKMVKMPNKGNIKIILVSASNESGDIFLFLYTLSTNYDIIDSLTIYRAEDMDLNGNLGSDVIKYSISEQYNVELKELYTPFASEEETLLNKKNYTIDDNGKFVKFEE